MVTFGVYEVYVYQLHLLFIFIFFLHFHSPFIIVLNQNNVKKIIVCCCCFILWSFVDKSTNRSTMQSGVTFLWVTFDCCCIVDGEGFKDFSTELNAMSYNISRRTILSNIPEGDKNFALLFL